MSLVTTPSDILGVILKYVDGYDVGSLFLCGSRQLNGILRRLPLKLVFVSRAPIGHRYFPRFISHLDNVQEFILRNDAEEKEALCSGVDVSLIPPSVTAIDLCFHNAISAFHDPLLSSSDFWQSRSENRTDDHGSTIFLDLNRLFPRLESLRLDGQAGLTGALFASLPKSLLHLAVHSTSAIRTNITCLYNLPPLLRTFETNLEMFVPTPLPIEFNLPPFLESLGINVFINSVAESEMVLKSLPRNLKNINSLLSKEWVCGWKWLPHELSIYTTGRMDEAPSPSDIKKLPKGLKKLKLNTWAECSQQGLIQSLPNKLESLTWETFVGDVSDFCQLPKSLTELQIGLLHQFDLNCFSSCPPKLAHMSFETEIITPASFRYFPRTLTSLSLDRIFDPMLFALAQSQARLRSLTAIGGSLSVEGVKALPTSLTSLVCVLKCFPNISSLKYLPPNLEILDCSPFATCTDDFWEDPDGISGSLARLPKSLSFIHLRYRNFDLSEPSMGDILFGLEHFPYLKTLICEGFKVCPESLLHLPQSLTRLHISLPPQSRLNGRVHFSKLPSGLRRLDLEGHVKFANEMDSLNYFPKRLLSLRLPSYSPTTISLCHCWPSLMYLRLGTQRPCKKSPNPCCGKFNNIDHTKSGTRPSCSIIDMPKVF